MLPNVHAPRVQLPKSKPQYGYLHYKSKFPQR